MPNAGLLLILLLFAEIPSLQFLPRIFQVQVLSSELCTRLTFKPFSPFILRETNYDTDIHK